ncbi:MAG TPA: D-alanyl-D-alanine carboxypeptidase family protein [Bacillota bacterium]|nr:D-alanyl-D-alanine carboxypeptidase family protein [Bacillota bacterium]
MKRIFGILMIICLFCTIQPTLAAKTKRSKAIKPAVNAHAAVLMDLATGKVLFKKNSQDIMAPASTTKIMTAVLVLEQLNLAKNIAVGDVSLEGTSMDLVKGERKTVRELLYGLMLVSGNDAASVLAKTVSGTEPAFGRLMTKKAKLLGMNNTIFKNASGLPEIGHYSTAYDMALLTRYALKKPNFSKIVRTKYKEISGPKPGKTRNLKNHNKLLWKYPYATGVKTGYTVSAGGCLVASAMYKGRTLIAVVLKTSTIYDDCIKMFKYGFNRY